jgi:hypothetical protein
MHNHRFRIPLAPAKSRTILFDGCGKPNYSHCYVITHSVLPIVKSLNAYP